LFSRNHGLLSELDHYHRGFDYANCHRFGDSVKSASLEVSVK